MASFGFRVGAVALWIGVCGGCGAREGDAPRVDDAGAQNEDDGGARGANDAAASDATISCPSSWAACQPTEVLKGLTGMGASALSATHYYYYFGRQTSGGTLYRVSLSDGEKETLADVAEANTIAAMDLDDTRLYFIRDDIAAKASSVYALPIAGGTAVELDTSAAHPPNAMVGAIALSDDEVFEAVVFRFAPDRKTTQPGGLFAVPKSGGAARQLLGANLSWGVRVFGPHVYFSGQDIEGAPPGEAVVRVPLAGGAVETLLHAHVPSAFVVDASGLYWFDLGVQHVSIGGGPRRYLLEVAPPDGGRDIAMLKASLALDGDAVYAAASTTIFPFAGTPISANTSIVRIDHQGDVRTIVDAPTANELRGVRGESLYFADVPETSLYRVPRCGCR